MPVPVRLLAAALIAVNASALLAAPQVKTYKPEDVCRFRVEEGRLVVDSALIAEKNPAYRSIRIEGMPGTSYAQANDSLLRLTINQTRGSQRTYIRIEQRPGFLMLSRTEYGPEVRRVASLTQGSVAGEAKDSVVLAITETDARTNQVQKSETFDAEDLTTLRARHGRELTEAIGPIFRDFGARSFAVDPAVAEAVLVEPVAPAQLHEQVGKLVAQLDSDEFAVRDKAARELKRLGSAGVAVLRSLDESKLTPQQLLAVPQIIDSVMPVSPKEIQQLRSDRDFLLDCLYCEDLALRKLAFARLEQLLNRKLDLDLTASLEKRGDAIEKLRQSK